MIERMFENMGYAGNDLDECELENIQSLPCK